MKVQVLGSPSGSVGPYVTAKNRSGYYQRARVTPLNPQTPSQQHIRSVMASVASLWRSLTEPQREAWAALATQVDAALTGFNLYARVNCTLALAGDAVVTVPPLIPSFGIFSASGVTATVTAGENPVLALSVDGEAVTPAPDFFQVEAAPPVSAGIKNRSGSYRTLFYADAIADIDTGLSAAYVAAFGTPALGQRLAVKITQVTKGFKSVPLMLSTIVAAAG